MTGGTTNTRHRNAARCEVLSGLSGGSLQRSEQRVVPTLAASACIHGSLRHPKRRPSPSLTPGTALPTSFWCHHAAPNSSVRRADGCCRLDPFLRPLYLTLSRSRTVTDQHSNRLSLFAVRLITFLETVHRDLDSDNTSSLYPFGSLGKKRRYGGRRRLVPMHMDGG